MLPSINGESERVMKRTINLALLMCLVLLVSALIFTACDNTNDSLVTEGTTTEITTPNETTPNETTPEGTTTPEETTPEETTPASHTHDWVIDPYVASTCTQTGLTSGKHCSICGYVKSAQKVIPAYGHNIVTDKAVDPTCTQTGLTEGRHCSTCGFVEKEQAVIPKREHTIVIDKAVAPTCTTTGLTEGSHCNRCNKTLVAQKNITALGHNYSVWVQTLVPTCTNTGTEERECSVCHKKEIKSVDALGHYYNSIATKETCISDAFSVTTCSRCNEQQNLNATKIKFNLFFLDDGSIYRKLGIKNLYGGLPVYENGQLVRKKYSVKVTDINTGDVEEFANIDEQIGYCQLNITALEFMNHSLQIEISDGYCTYIRITSKANVSDDYSSWNYEYQDINYLSHIYNSIVIEPTKVMNGYTIHTCSLCGDSYKDNFVLATGSAGLAYEINTDSTTCTVTGIGTCTDTEIYITEEIDGYTVTAIGDKAFAENATVTKIVLPNTVTTIGRRAFYKCTEITEFTVPSSVTNIGAQIFYGCDKLTTVYYNSRYGSSENPFLNVKNLETVVFGGTSIPNYIVYGVTSLKTVVICDSVTSIGQSAFYGCSKLTNITIPDGVTNIGWGAFYGCSSLTSITIPDSITSISDSAFWGCSSLTSITIPDSVTRIDRQAFAWCDGLTSIMIPDSVTSIGEYAFYHCSSLTSIEIPDSVTSIKGWAFEGCSSLTSITIPDSITSIGIQSFKGCSSLTSIEIPDSVTSIGTNAFCDCSSLMSIKIPDSVMSIDSNAFDSCEALTSITIPDSVTSIGDYAFRVCSKLTSITFEGTVAQWKAIELDNNWDSYSSIAKIICSDGTVTLNYTTVKLNNNRAPRAPSISDGALGVLLFLFLQLQRFFIRGGDGTHCGGTEGANLEGVNACDGRATGAAYCILKLARVLSALKEQGCRSQKRLRGIKICLVACESAFDCAICKSLGKEVDKCRSASRKCARGIDFILGNLVKLARLGERV